MILSNVKQYVVNPVTLSFYLFHHQIEQSNIVNGWNFKQIDLKKQEKKRKPKVENESNHKLNH